jgi:NitT/TauT family transport system substrate-binding protein
MWNFVVSAMASLAPNLISGARFVTVAGVCAVAATGLTSCRPGVETNRAPLRVGIDLWAGYYPLILADELGYLQARNVRIDLTVPGDTHKMVADFAARNYDLICVSLADIILTTRVQSDIRMILASDESAGGDQLLARSPIRAAADLRGRRIGTALGGFGEIFVRHYLDRYGVHPDEVTLVNVDATATQQLLQRGEIDIGHTWEPHATAARAAGFQAVFSSRDTPGLILDGMVTHLGTIEQRRDDLHALVQEWFRALEWWRAHPAEGNALIERRLKLAPGAVSTEGIHLLNQKDNLISFSGDADQCCLHQAVHEYVEFFVARGELSRRLKATELLDARFIR